MIESELDTANSILRIRPESALEAKDFEALAQKVDPYLEAEGELRGLIIEIPSFPGWKNLSSMLAHFRFVQDHHKRIGKVAVVTDSFVGEMAEHLASHFIAAKIRHFSLDDMPSAEAWLQGEA